MFSLPTVVNQLIAAGRQKYFETTSYKVKVKLQFY